MIVSECGMFAGEAILQDYRKRCSAFNNLNFAQRVQLTLLRKLHDLGCYIGATPDGIITRSNDKSCVEALEVKNHCPFQMYQNHKNPIRIVDKEPTESLPKSYIPQLQLEMFCIGFHCRSAILIRLTATKGSIIHRIHRNDEYIEIVLRRILKFFKNYVVAQKPPESNFGSNDRTLERIVELTHRIAEESSVIARIPHKDIQRCQPFNTPLLR